MACRENLLVFMAIDIRVPNNNNANHMKKAGSNGVELIIAKWRISQDSKRVRGGWKTMNVSGRHFRSQLVPRESMVIKTMRNTSAARPMKVLSNLTCHPRLWGFSCKASVTALQPSKVLRTPEIPPIDP